MEKYKILEHIGDLKILVLGKTKKDLFKNALRAMAEILSSEINSSKKIKRIIKVNSYDLNSLLVDFLNEVLFLTQINKEVYKYLNFLKFNNNEIKAEIKGQKVKRFNNDIKAVTYHNLKIERDKNKILKAEITFDI